MVYFHNDSTKIQNYSNLFKINVIYEGYFNFNRYNGVRYE